MARQLPERKPKKPKKKALILSKPLSMPIFIASAFVMALIIYLMFLHVIHKPLFGVVLNQPSLSYYIEHFESEEIKVKDAMATQDDLLVDIFAGDPVHFNLKRNNITMFDTPPPNSMIEYITDNNGENIILAYYPVQTLNDKKERSKLWQSQY